MNKKTHPFKILTLVSFHLVFILALVSLVEVVYIKFKVMFYSKFIRGALYKIRKIGIFIFWYIDVFLSVFHLKNVNFLIFL